MRNFVKHGQQPFRTIRYLHRPRGLVDADVARNPSQMANINQLTTIGHIFSRASPGDFKKRGEIPFVEAGTVLAEKIPMIEARKGHNIYGHEIETTPGKTLGKIGR